MSLTYNEALTQVNAELRILTTLLTQALGENFQNAPFSDDEIVLARQQRHMELTGYKELFEGQGAIDNPVDTEMEFAQLKASALRLLQEHQRFPWKSVPFENLVTTRAGKWVAHTANDDISKYIAQSSPEVILNLILRIESLEQALQSHDDNNETSI